MNRRSALTFTVLLLVASAAAALPAVTASSTPTSTTGGGNNTSSAPMLTITTDKSSYSPGDTIMVNASVSGLTINNTYTIDAWISGFSQNYSRNWTAYQNSSSEQFNFTAVNSSGYKMAYVKLWTSSSSWVQKNTYISISSSSTGGNSSSGGNQTGGNSSSGGNSSTGGSNSSTSPSFSFTTDQYSYAVGDTIEVDVSVSGLTYNNSYRIDAWLGNQTYYRNWTAYQNTSSEQFNFTALTSGSAWVYVKFYTTSTSSSTKYKQVNITSGQYSMIVVNTNRSWYYTGDQVSIKMDSANLKLNDSYTLSWTFDNNTYSRNWTATSSTNTEWWNFTANKAGNFYLNVTLSNGSSTWNYNRYIWIYTRSLSVQITTDKSVYAVGDRIQVNVSVSYLTLNSNYSMKAWMGSQVDYRNWTAYQNTSSEQFNFTAIASTSSSGSQYVYVRITQGTSSSTFYKWFTVTSPSVSMDRTYYSYRVGDQVSINMTSSNLDLNESYKLSWTYDNTTYYERYWTAASNSSVERWNFTANNSGYFYMNVTLSAWKNSTSGYAPVSNTYAHVSIYLSLPVTITTDRSNYTKGDTINVNVSVSNLTLNTAYTMEAWRGSVKYYRNWTAYQNSSTEQFNFTATMPSWWPSTFGSYNQYISVRILTVNSSTPTYHTSVSVSASNSTTTPVPWVQANTSSTSYTNGSTVRAWIGSYNLTNGTNYSLEWDLAKDHMAVFTSVDSGWFNWTAYGSYSGESLNWTGLGVGWYCLDVELYQIHSNGSSSWPPATATSCFSVTASNNTTVSDPVPWVQTNTSSTSYTNDSTVWAWVDSHNLTIGTNYSLEWTLSMDTGQGLGTIVDYGQFNWTAYYNSSYESLNWSGLMSGYYYCLDVNLYRIDNNSPMFYWFDSDWSCFSVTASNDTTPPSPSVVAGTDWTNYTEGDVIRATIDSHDLVIGTNYSVVWRLESPPGFWLELRDDSGDDMVNWTAWQNSSKEYSNWTGLDEGWYCFVVDLYHVADDYRATLLNSDAACFVVSNGTQTNDFDGDGLDDAVDDDDDNDGVNDVMDAFPLDPDEWADLDGDGIGDNADPDDDGDGANDSVDAFPYNGSEQADADGDGMGDNIDQCDDTPSGTPILSNGCHSPVVTSTPDNITVNATLAPVMTAGQTGVPSMFVLGISVSNPDGWEGAHVNWHVEAPASTGENYALTDVAGHLLIESSGALLDQNFELSEVHAGSLCLYWNLYSSNQSSNMTDQGYTCVTVSGEENTTSEPTNLPPTCAIHAPLISAGLVTTDAPAIANLVSGTVETVTLVRGTYYAIAKCTDPDGDVVNVTVNGLSYEGTEVMGYAVFTIDETLSMIQVSVLASDGINTLSGLFTIQLDFASTNSTGSGNTTGSSDAAGESGAGGFVPAVGLLPTLMMGLAAALLASRRRKQDDEHDA